MNDLMNKDDLEITRERKKAAKILDFKKRITDETYIDSAISRIATDLSHYLTK
jgi:hypothetical protein